MIRWDALLAHHTARELDALLRGERVRALRLDGAARDLVLLFRERALLWRLHPTRGHLRILPAISPAASDVAVRARIVGVVSVPDDRLVRFALAPAAAGRPPMSVVVELLGNQWNAVVTEGVADGHGPEIVRHVLWRRDVERGARVGHPYTPPSPLERRGVAGDLSREDWLGLLAAVEPVGRPRVLVKSIAWTSPLNAPALLGAGRAEGRAEAGAEGGADADAVEGADPAAGAAADDAQGLATGYQRWRRMTDPSGAAEPVVLEADAGPQPYPFPLPGYAHRAVSGLLDAFQACAEGEAHDAAASPHPAAAANNIGPALMRRLEDAGVRAARRQERLERELAQLEDPDVLRQVGDLILARYTEIPAGASRALLTGFDGTDREVVLEPAQAPHENAADYYAKATKAERARAQLPGLIDEAGAERARMEALVERARAGEADEEAVREVLGPDEPTQHGQVVGPALPYRAYRSSGGLEIRVGRGARHNDDLTFHHSSPGDVWLHARDNAGAHVVLRWQGPGNPPGRDLAEAATLAALHSKARTSGSAPVDWTLRKYVRKPRKSPPGRVVAERVATLFVAPDEELLERLERLR